MRAVASVSLAALVVFLLASVRLGRLERGGPAHSDLVLPGGIPATLTVPWEGDAWSAFAEAPPRGERPPALLLVHGFASDRVGVSSLARRLAGAGYAVLTIDLRGHGENRHPFHATWAMPDYFRDDLAAAVDFLRATPLVDGTRIALAGHSMGAGAVLDYATRDSGIDAVVPISGGWALQGPYRPPNVLFLFAAGDPERIASRVSDLAARLAGGERLAPGETRGDLEKGTGVRLVRVPGADHAGIVWSAATAREIASWLDAVFGTGRPRPPPGDPRLPVALVIALSIPLVLPGLGLLTGRLVPAGPPLPARGRGTGLLLVAGALLTALPLQAVGSPGEIVSLEVGDRLVTQLGVSGSALLVLLALRGGVWPPLPSKDAPRVLAGAAVATIAVYLLLQPFGAVVHRLTLTPERVAVFLVCAVALLPFAAAFELLLRRGAPLSAALWAAAGRVLVLASFVVGVWAGILPRVVLLMLPALVFVFFLVETLAASLYAASRNLAAIALIEAALLALVFAASMPIRI